MPIGAENQAALSAVDCLRRRYAMKPTPAKPRIIMAQVEGLGDCRYFDHVQRTYTI